MDFKELKQNIKERHEILYPNATLQTQLAKFEEEYNEFGNAKTQEGVAEEAADMLIVAFGLARFSDIASQLASFFTYQQAYMLRDDVIHEQVLKKMGINEKRTWNNKDGNYKHKEGE